MQAASRSERPLGSPRPSCRSDSTLAPVTADEEGRAVGVRSCTEILVAGAEAAARAEQDALRRAETVLVPRAWPVGLTGRSDACATLAGRRHRPAIRVAAAGDNVRAAHGRRRLAGRRAVVGAGPLACAVHTRLLPEQRTPQPPQLRGSVSGSTQAPPQHLRGRRRAGHLTCSTDCSMHSPAQAFAPRWSSHAHRPSAQT